jgi:phosphoserine phosphatase
MNVFDFDNTIYDGESAVDIFFYCCKKDKSLIRYFPAVMLAMIKYKKGSLTIEKALQDYAPRVIDYIIEHGDDLSQSMEHFWDTHMHKIKPFYKEIQQEDDLIISCSPEFSLNIICKRLGIKKLIGTDIDLKTGEVKRFCFRENKVKAFMEQYPNTVIENFYTDSVNDTPLIEISNNAYLVKGNKITKIK